MSDPQKGKPLSYADAGVNIDAGAEVVRRIRAAVASTATGANIIGGLGGFAGMVEMPAMEKPVLVSAADGVGTKVLIAEAMGRYDTVGIDLVAMSVNDLITTGARPLFFLDYIATGHLVPEKAAALVEGIAAGCRRSGCLLLGGETAEMPDVYQDGDFDLAGFAVGVVEKDRIIDGGRVEAGDLLIGILSSGIHSNGFSLVRKILDVNGVTYNDRLEGAGDRPVGEALLEPTEIYAGRVASLLETCDVRAMAHITGGGLPENLPRVLPEGLGVRVDTASWRVPSLFRALQRLGSVEPGEMFRTFNMGVGYVAVVPAADREKAMGAVPGALVIGEVVPGAGEVELAGGE